MNQDVQNGAALLDERVPGWENRIDLCMLAIAYPDHCILGQLYGGYMTGLRELGLGLGAQGSQQHGFTAATENGCSQLDREWTTLIERRLDVKQHAELGS